jgi:hypothetical protein
MKRQQFLVANPVVGDEVGDVANVGSEDANEAVPLEKQEKRVAGFLESLLDQPGDRLLEASDPQ